MVTCQVTRFRMLICGNSGSGKDKFIVPYADETTFCIMIEYIYMPKNLEQQKYKDMLQTLTDISK